MTPSKLIENIEKHAPPKHTEGRRELYRDLKARLGAGRFAEALYVVNNGYQIRNVIAPKDYWARRRRLIRDLNRAIEKFRSDPIVQSTEELEKAEVAFYLPSHVVCRHGRNRKSCERGRALLIKWDQLCRPVHRRKDPLYRQEPFYSDKAAVEREIRDLLGKPNLRLDRVRLHHFCQPVEGVDRCRLRGEKNTGGRPRGIQGYLLKSLVGYSYISENESENEEVRGVLRARLRRGLRPYNLDESLTVVREVLQFCFDHRVKAESLRRSWLSLRSAATRGVKKSPASKGHVFAS